MNTSRPINIFFLILVLLLAFSAGAQQKDSLGQELIPSSLEDIIALKPEISAETKVTIANLLETNVYDAPNVVTIITEEDIKALGMRDLLDILNTIPGINMANDVQNGTSLGIRGMWAEEGKVLFMINGMVLNDMAYGSIILGHRFPLANIKRIEVIRGAGSSIYGGLAALGVINIITKSGQETNGHNLSTAGGVSNNSASRSMLNYNYGGILLREIELTATGLINTGNRSNERYNLPDSTLTNFKDSSIVNNAHVLFTLKYKDLRFKQLYEDYNFQATYEPIFSLCRTSISDISYNFKFKKININPMLTYKLQTPWNTQYGDPAIYDRQNLVTSRVSLGFNGEYKPLPWMVFLFGGQYYNDTYRYHRKKQPLNNGKLKQAYDGYIAYSEINVITKFVNINIGGRFDQYAYFKPIILPRISLTKGFKAWYYKLIYGESFKIPSLQNINLDISNNLIPERVTDNQAELGFHSTVFDINATVFQNTIKHIIVFGYDSKFNESYINSRDATTRGIELETKLKLGRFTLKSSYSYYRLVKCTTNEIMVDTADVKKGTLGFPTHKLVNNLMYRFNEKNTVSLSYIFETEKYSFERINSVSGAYGLIRYPETHVMNVTYQRTGLFNKLLDINVGIFNVLNTGYLYSYPFSQGYSPVMGMGRELFVNFRLNL